MNKLTIPILGFLILFFACRKETHEYNTTIKELPPIKLVESSFKGKVLDEAGEPVAGAKVRIFQSVAITDTKGNFSFNNIKAAKGNSLVKVEKAGYFTSAAMSGSVSGTKQFVKITMLSKGTAQPVSGSLGGTVTNTDGSKVIIKPKSIRFKNGGSTPYEGIVKVFSKWIDPTDPQLGAKMPGALMAIDDKGDEKVLATYGMMALDFETDSGEALELREDNTAGLELPIPAALLDQAEIDVPLWKFDLEQERWLLNGVCHQSGGAYHCSVPSTGYWNCDVPLEAICLSGTVLQSDSTPAYFTKVIVEDLSNNFLYYGYSDINGFFCGSVPKDAPLKITIEDFCGNVLYSQEIGPYSVDFNLENIYLPLNLNEYIIHFTGQLDKCSGQPVTLGQVEVSFPGKSKLFPLDSTGKINFNLKLNCIEFPELQITGYDLDNLFVTNPIFVTDNGDIDLGTITTCAPSVDYFNFLSSLGNFSIAPTKFFYEINTTDVLNFEAKTVGGIIDCQIKQYTGVGSYNASISFSILDYLLDPMYILANNDGNTLTVTVTSDDGNYIIGTISGSLNRDGDIGQPFDFTGDFKVKKEL
jgi:hypothetical protein